MVDLFKFNDSDGGCQNDSCLSDEDFLKKIIFPPIYIWIIEICLNSLVFSCGLVGNGVVVWSVFRNRDMWTATNLLVGNLAISDFLVLFFCLPPTLVYDITETWFLGDTLCKIVPYFQLASFSVSIMTLTWISGERWYAVCHPYECLRTKHWAKRRAIIAITVIWITSFILSIPNLVFLETRPHPALPKDLIYFTKCRPSWDDKKLDSIVTFVKFGIFYALPLTAMAFAYYQMFPKLWGRLCLYYPSTNSESNSAVAPLSISNDPATTNRPENATNHRNHTNNNSSGRVPYHNNSKEAQLRLSREKAKMLGVVVIVFAVLHFPIHLVIILRYAEVALPRNRLKAAALISHLICYFNSAINPVIYYKIMNKKYRRQFRRSIASFRWLSLCFSSWFSTRTVRGESIPLTAVIAAPSSSATAGTNSVPAIRRNTI